MLEKSLPRDYEELLARLKERVRTAQVRAAVSVNRELVLLYWHIGREILSRQEQEGWGAGVIDRLARDLRKAFPEMKGFSPRNLKYMRALAEAYPDEPFVQQAVAQLPWGHNVRILDYVKDPAERAWYIGQAVRYGWSRSVLVHQIESDLCGRQGRAVTNFDQTLPAPQSDLARETIKDPYVFDFLSLAPEARERDLSRALLDHVRDFLLELGVGFALVGVERRLEVGGQDFYVDLLFYHLKLRCFVVIDLKVGDFQPEHAGKMNFYLSAVDDLLRAPEDRPSIGIILCKTHNRVVAEYALRDLRKPMGVATYRLPPKELRKSLPTAEQIEAELGAGRAPDAAGGT